MKQSLQLKLGQSLTMTPQLQQAIRLLQLSTLDLQTEIQQALESNPMLEATDDDASSAANGSTEAEPPDTPADADSIDDVPAATGTIDDAAVAADNSDDWSNEIPDDVAVESNWEDTYPTTAPTSAGSADNDFDFDSRNSSEETLHDHLMWQLNLTSMSDTDRIIAMAIIDGVDDNGMLDTSVEDLHSSFVADLEIELDEVQAVLHRVQQFDPPGVATHDLQECLTVQLQQLPKDTPWLAEALGIVGRYMHLLGNRDYAQLMRRTRLKEEQLKHTIGLIQSLNPRPGDSVASSKTEYIVPDVFVRKVNNRWVVDLNPEVAPKLRINADYASMVKRADNSQDNNYLKDNLQEARWFLKSLQSRNETLMKVATCIVEHQLNFFEYGDEAMKPMVLADIATDVDMHESTISRVTTRKYMHTPRAIYELKYFFSSHVSTSSGGECSSTAIRALIKKLVAAENPRKPLSDNKITTLLGEQGIEVARRTIAKYRESLHIPPSNERKRLV
ncbi:MAG: RNA polymerase factor sigma-54 [Pseudomonadales bacterium]